MKVLITNIIGSIMFCSSAVIADSYDYLRANNKTCVPSSEMRIADVHLLDTKDSVLEKLGEPERRAFKKVQVFLDPLEILSYPGLEIQMVNSDRHKVHWVICNSPECSTPSGIRPGESADRVSEVLGFDIETIEQPHYKSLNKYFIHRCIGMDEQIDVEQYFSFEVTDDYLINSIEIYWVAP